MQNIPQEIFPSPEKRKARESKRETLILGSFEDVLRCLKAEQDQAISELDQNQLGSSEEEKQAVLEEIGRTTAQMETELRQVALEPIIPLRIIDVGPETVTSEEETPGAQEKLQNNELLDSAESSENALAQELIQAYPERAEAIWSRLEAKRRLRQEITSSAEISGKSKNKPLRVTLESGMEAVYKPVSREQPELAKGIEAGSYAKREWLAEQIDQAIGLDMVPATILRNGSEGLGSLQEWKNDCDVAMGVDYWEAPRAEMLKLALFDALTRNIDRHAGNFLIEKGTGKIYAIDSAMIFSGDPADKSWSAALREVGGQELGQEEFSGLDAKLDGLLKSSAVQRALRKAFETALGERASEAWTQFMGRLQDFKSNRRLPKSEQ